MSRFLMQSAANSSALRVPRAAVAVCGLPLDERGIAAVDFVRAHATEVYQGGFDRGNVGVTLAGEYLDSAALESFVRAQLGGRLLLLETTSLGFLEIFMLCAAVRDAGGGRVGFLYAEPREYSRLPGREVLKQRDFELSDEVEDFSAVPGAAILLQPERPARGVFLVGYEGQRLDQAFEQTNLRPSDCAVVFGVPAFQPGWEMNSFDNNYLVLKQRGVTELYFGGAQNPSAAYSAITRIHQSCRPGERMLIAPIGTKPHGIGAAVYACDHDDVGLLYDNPLKSKHRSKRVAQWHYFEAQLGL